MSFRHYLLSIAAASTRLLTTRRTLSSHLSGWLPQ
jgi:hypothetical protein